MSAREQLARNIWDLPEEAIGVVSEFVLFEIEHSKRKNTEKSLRDFERGFERFMKYRGTLKRDIDYKEELAKARDEKYIL